MSVELKYGDGETIVELYDIASDVDDYDGPLCDVLQIASTGRVRIRWHEKPLWGSRCEWISASKLDLHARTM